MDLFEAFWVGVVNTPPLEWFAVITGILYVIFAAKRHIICWLFAFLSSVSFVYLCFTFQLYIETGLQFFFVVMAIVGWLNWEKQKKKDADLSEDQQQEIKTWKLKWHVANVAGSGAVALLLGFLFDYFTDQANPYMDAFTTVFSLVATFMVAQKVLENWIYWVIIDFVSIFLYFSRELYLSSLLYVIFTILAIFGFVAWYKKYKLQPQL